MPFPIHREGLFSFMGCDKFQPGKRKKTARKLLYKQYAYANY